MSETSGVLQWWIQTFRLGGRGGGSQKNLFSVLRASVSSRYKAKGGGRGGGGGGPPLDPPLFSAFIISFG